jgi:hypothetical protein
MEIAYIHKPKNPTHTQNKIKPRERKEMTKTTNITY